MQFCKGKLEITGTIGEAAFALPSRHDSCTINLGSVDTAGLLLRPLPAAPVVQLQRSATANASSI